MRFHCRLTGASYHTNDDDMFRERFFAMDDWHDVYGGGGTGSGTYGIDAAAAIPSFLFLYVSSLSISSSCTTRPSAMARPLRLPRLDRLPPGVQAGGVSERSTQRIEGSQSGGVEAESYGGLVPG